MGDGKSSDSGGIRAVTRLDPLDPPLRPDVRTTRPSYRWSRREAPPNLVLEQLSGTGGGDLGNVVLEAEKRLDASASSKLLRLRAGLALDGLARPRGEPSGYFDSDLLMLETFSMTADTTCASRSCRMTGEVGGDLRSFSGEAIMAAGVLRQDSQVVRALLRDPTAASARGGQEASRFSRRACVERLRMQRS